MTRRALLAALVGVSAAAEAAAAQPARVERRGPAEVTAAAGEALTLPFRVTNVASAAARLPGTAEPPPGWGAVGAAAPRELAPGEAELRLVGIRVPAGAAAGRHVVRYRAGASADSVVLVVPVRRALAADPLEQGAMVVAGDAYELRFRVENRGNVVERLALGVEGDQGIRPVADPAALVLPPGGAAVAVVRGATDGSARTSLRHQATLRISAGEGDEAPTASASTVVAVVPRGSGRASGPRLPVELRVGAADDLSGASFALAARGPLDAAGRLRLDLTARTADPPGTPFARQDEVRLAIAGPGFGVRLGDGVHGLSRLVDGAGYGFGATGWARRGWITAGGVVRGDRRGQGGEAMAGGFARIGTARARLGLNLAAPDSAPVRWTLDVHGEPHRLLRVEAEAAPGAPDSVVPRSVRIAGSHPALSYELLHLRGAPAPPGAPSADHDVASLTLRPLGALALSASLRRGVERGARDDSAGYVREVRRAALSWGSRLMLEARESAGGAADRRGFRSLSGRVGIPLLHSGWVHPGIEVGRATGEGEGAGRPYRILSLHANLRAEGASLWGEARLREGASPFSRGTREAGGALAAELALLPRTSLHVTAHGRRIDDGPLEGGADVALEQLLPASHRVSIRARTTIDATGYAEPRMSIDYSVPIGIPLPGSGDRRVLVRIADSRTGRGMEGVLVRLGDRMAVTDRRGRAGFAEVADGTYTLRAVPAAGAGLVPDRDLPVEVRVVGGRAERVEVGFAPAAALAGRVDRIPAAAGAAALPMAGIVVEVSDPSGVRRAVTDAEGRFEITGLRPGWWRMRIDPASLPRHHEAEPGGHVLLRPGATLRVVLTAAEKERSIQVIQSRDLTPP